MSRVASAPALQGSVVVLSPHLDDAVLSLGATIAASVRAGASVRVVTVFSGDPTSTRAASRWEVQCGFSSAAEAARTRRDEDTVACGRIGATTTWLPHLDVDHAGPRDADALWASIAPELAGAETILVPGSPLLHPDHELLMKVALDHRPPGLRLGLFSEQPYLFWEFVGPRSASGRLAAWAGCLVRSPSVRRRQEPITPPGLASRGVAPAWERSGAGPYGRLKKLRAIRAYQSQLRGFGRGFISQIALYEWGRGGESVAWIA